MHPAPCTYLHIRGPLRTQAPALLHLRLHRPSVLLPQSCSVLGKRELESRIDPNCHTEGGGVGGGGGIDMSWDLDLRIVKY